MNGINVPLKIAVEILGKDKITGAVAEAKKLGETGAVQAMATQPISEELDFEELHALKELYKMSSTEVAMFQQLKEISQAKAQKEQFIKLQDAFVGAKGLGAIKKGIGGMLASLSSLAKIVLPILGLAAGIMLIIQASKMLQRTLGNIGKILLMFLKPIGDMLAILLRPLLMVLRPLALVLNLVWRFYGAQARAAVGAAVRLSKEGMPEQATGAMGAAIGAMFGFFGEVILRALGPAFEKLTAGSFNTEEAIEGLRKNIESNVDKYVKLANTVTEVTEKIKSMDITMEGLVAEIDNAIAELMKHPAANQELISSLQELREEALSGKGSIDELLKVWKEYEAKILDKTTVDKAIELATTFGESVDSIKSDVDEASRAFGNISSDVSTNIDNLSKDIGAIDIEKLRGVSELLEFNTKDVESLAKKINTNLIPAIENLVSKTEKEISEGPPRTPPTLLENILNLIPFPTVIGPGEVRGGLGLYQAHWELTQEFGDALSEGKTSAEAFNEGMDSATNSLTRSFAGVLLMFAEFSSAIHKTIFGSSPGGLVDFLLYVNKSSNSLINFQTSIAETITAMGNALERAELAAKNAERASISAQQSALRAPLTIGKFSIMETAILPEREYQGGTSFVPETGSYLLHKGEKVIPAGREEEKSRSIIINFGGVTIYANDGDDIKRKLDEWVDDTMRKYR